jgi:outer membrane lipoprotein-sorting protein
MILMLLLILQPAKTQELPDPQTVLRGMLEAERKVDFVGKRLVIDFSRWYNMIREERVTNKSPDKRRIDVLLPPDIAGLTMVRDGEHRWQTPPRRRGELPPHLPKPPIGPDRPREDMELMLRNYSVEISEGERIAGRNTYLLEITPKYEGRPSKRIWSDAKKGIPLRMEHYNSEGKLASLIVYTEISFPPRIDERLFVPPEEVLKGRKGRFGPPEGGELSLEELKRRISFPIIVPGYIPAGFEFQNARLIRYQRREIAHLRYTDGLVLLSLFETRGGRPERRGERRRMGRREIEEERGIKILGVECKLLYNGQLRILRWEHNGLNFTLIGDLSEREMIKVTRSLIAREG